MKSHNQFIVWKRIVEADGKINKIPQLPDGSGPGDAHNPANWMSYDGAVAMVMALGGAPYGVGFVFTRGDPYFFIDLDHCYDPATQQWNEQSQAIIAAFPGALSEWSTSGTGAHIFGRYAGQLGDRRQRADGVELYTERHFVALTEQPLYPDQACSADTDYTPQLNWLVESSLKRDAGAGSGGASLEWTTEPVQPGVGAPDAAAALRILLSMRSGVGMFGGGVTPAQLWNADEVALASVYPPQNAHDAFDHSAADMALCSHLSFVTGGNCQMMWDLVWQSGLVRDKWHDRPDYLSDTILKVVQGSTVFYTGKASTGAGDTLPVAGDTAPPAIPGDVANTPPMAAPASATPGVGVGLLAVTQQIEHFRDCVYVRDVHKVFTPDGALVKPKAFEVMYSGFEFVIDGQGKTTTNAFDAFAKSRVYDFPKASATCFRPDLEPRVMVGDAVNIFVPQYGARVAGDVTPFLEHVGRLLPDPGDQDIVLSYMAACLQYPGVKFQWCPVIQGLEGNGKTVLYTLLEYAIGQRYCFQVDPKDIDNKFNAWIANRMLICIEEIRTGGRREVADALKPLITNTRVASQAKGEDQTTADNCANFLLFSNHKDAVLKTVSDRRYAVFYTAQQEYDDLEIMGMMPKKTEDVFSYLNQELEVNTIKSLLRDIHAQKPPEQTALQPTSTGELQEETLKRMSE